MTLTVSVMGGLCSRLRVVCAGLAYANDHGHELCVNWPIDERHLNAHWGGFRAKLADLLVGPWTETNMPSQIQWRPPIRHHDDAAGLAIYTVHPEHILEHRIERIGAVLSSLKVSPLVADEMVALPHPVIGVHVRHWLRQPETKDASWHIASIIAIRRMYGDIPVFLSCDSRDVSSRVHAELKNVLELSKTYDYDRLGIIRSCADLFLLAKCDWIVGANCSSYSQMAAFMTGAEYVGTHERPGGLRGGRYEDAWNPQELPNELA